MIGLCDRWHKTPDEIYACDAGTLLRLLNLMQYSRGQEETAEPDPLEAWAN